MRMMTKELKHTKQVMHDATAHRPVPTQFLSSRPQLAFPQVYYGMFGVEKDLWKCSNPVHC